MEAVYDCPKFIKNHQQCIPVTPELGRERGMKDLAITLAG